LLEPVATTLPCLNCRLEKKIAIALAHRAPPEGHQSSHRLAQIANDEAAIICCYGRGGGVGRGRGVGVGLGGGVGVDVPTTVFTGNEGMPFTTTTRSLAPSSTLADTSNCVVTISPLPTGSTPILLWLWVRV